MQSLFCARRRRFVKKQKDYNVHIAIDLGTDGLGVAYAIKNNIYVPKCSSNAYGQSKPQCIALFDDNEQLISFGNNAKHTYFELSHKQRKSWMLFDQFKIGLYNNGISINETLTATNGLRMSCSKIFSGIYKYVYDDCIEWLNNNNISISNNEIEWIIPVPSICNDESKNCMRKWAELGGLLNIRIVYESDCASLSILYYLHKTRKHLYYDVESRFDAHREKKFGISFERDDRDSNKKEKFSKGDKYILIDVGCGVTNISSHELYNKFSVKEILSSSGGLWGSNIINKRFNDLLNRIFSIKWMNEFKNKNYDKYIELMNNFNTTKIECFKNKSSKWYKVHLPVEFIWFFEDKCDDLEEYIQENWLGEKDIKKVVLEDEYLKLNIKTWNKLFDKAIDPIIESAKEILNDDIMKKDNKCKYLCMVGGLASSMYFQGRMEKEFGKYSEYELKIIIPKQPMLSVVTGGAYYGITKNFIRSRRLGKTYGVRVNLSLGSAYKLGIPNKHIYNNLAFNSEKNICHIRNCFEVMAKRGEEIRINQVIIRKSKRLSGMQKSIIKYIYSSDRKNPKIIDDNAKKLSEIKLNFDKRMKDMVIVTEFHFYDTEFMVIVYPESAPDLKKEVELSYVNC